MARKSKLLRPVNLKLSNASRELARLCTRVALWSRRRTVPTRQRRAPNRRRVTRNRGPSGSSFANADELEALLLDAGPARPMTSERKGRIYGDLKS